MSGLPPLCAPSSWSSPGGRLPPPSLSDSFLSSASGSSSHDVHSAQPDEATEERLHSPLGPRAEFEEVQHALSASDAMETATLVRELVQQALGQLSQALTLASQEALYNTHAPPLEAQLTTCLRSKSSEELRSLLELERAIAMQEILRKKGPLIRYVHDCQQHLSTALRGVVTRWGSAHRGAIPISFEGLQQGLYGSRDVVEKIKAAITASGRLHAIGITLREAPPHEEGSELAGRVVAGYSQNLEAFMGMSIFLAPAPGEALPEWGQRPHTWISLDNYQAAEIRATFEAQALSMIHDSCTEDDLRLLWASEQSPLYREWMATKTAAAPIFASYS